MPPFSVPCNATSVSSPQTCCEQSWRDAPDPEAEMDMALAPLFLLAGRYREQLDAAVRAARLARELGNHRLLAEAEVLRGCALNQLGYLEEGRAVQEAAILLAEAAADLPSLSHALNDVGFLTEVGGEFEISRAYKERALQMAERAGDPLSIANMAFRCGQNAFLRGDWAEADRFFHRGLLTARPLGSSSISDYPPFGLALLAFARQDLSAARLQGQEALHIAADVDRQAERGALALLAECDLQEGTPRAAMQWLEQAGPEGDGLGLYPVAPVLAETLLALGKGDKALETAEQAVKSARDRHHRVALVDALRARALAIGGDTSRRDLEQALSLARSMGYPYGEIRVLESRATLLSNQADLRHANELRHRLVGEPPAGIYNTSSFQ